MSRLLGMLMVPQVFGCYFHLLMKILQSKQFGGNPNAIQQPNYCKDGSVWTNYNVVWHMDGTSSTIVKESRVSAHATPYNFDELRVPGVIGTALSFDGIDDYVDLPLSVHPKSENRQLNISLELRWTKPQCVKEYNFI